MYVDLDEPSRATIIAALRAYQERLTSGQWPIGPQLKAIHDIAGDDDMPPLSPEDIDELCERMNLDAQPATAEKRPLFQGEMPEPHRVYQHFKGEHYEVLGIAKDAEAEEERSLVVYRRLDQPDQLFVRTVANFRQMVPDPKNHALKLPRFSPINLERASCVVVRSSLDEVTLAVVSWRKTPEVPGGETLLLRLTEAITQWIVETPAGREAWTYSGGDLNVGDLSSYVDGPQLKAKLAQFGIHDLEIEIHSSLELHSWTYDTVLADASAIEEHYERQESSAPETTGEEADEEGEPPAEKET